MALKLLLLFFLPMSAMASWDLSAEQLLRTFPTGLYLKSTAGYSKKFWQGDQPFLYGYIRPAITLQTSGLVNVGKAHVDFNPISFINLNFGKAYTKRNIAKISNFDCAQVICRGSLSRTFYGARLALTFKKILFMGGVKWTRVKLVEKSLLSFADELSSTIASPGEDLLIQKTFLAGYQLNSKLLLAYLGQFSRMRNTALETKMHMFLSQYQFNKRWKLTVGPGLFETRTGSKNLTILSLINWNYKEAPILAN